MKDTLVYLVQQLVDHASDVRIVEESESSRIVYTIHAHPDDMGKIIGKSGRIIKAIRDLMKILGAKHNIYIDVELAEDTRDARSLEDSLA